MTDCRQYFSKENFSVGWFDIHVSSQFVIYFKNCAVEKIGFCFKRFIFRFGARITFIDCFSKSYQIHF